MKPKLTAGEQFSVSLVRALSATVLSTLSMTKLGTRVARTEHAYGARALEMLDHLQPDKQSRPDAIVYLHGGGWIAGDKRYYTKDLAFLPANGYSVFNLNYPLAPEDPHPHALRALLRAVGWIREHHAEVESIHVMGDSAGGGLAAMYGVLYSNPELLARIAPDIKLDSLLPPRSVVSLYGMLDRETSLGDDPDDAPNMVRIFLQSYGGASALELNRPAAEQAITPMDLEFSDHPPCFIGVGTKDFLLASSRRYAEHLAQLQAPCVEKHYPGAPHGFINLRHDQTPQLKADVLEFLGSV